MEKEKTVKISFETWKQLTKLAKSLNKSRKSILAEIISPLTEQLEGLETANMKVLKHPFKRILIVEFYGREKLYLEQNILTIQGKVKKHE